MGDLGALVLEATRRVTALLGLWNATEWLAFALVLVTAYYAWQNRRMAVEMSRTRIAQIRPGLLVDVRPYKLGGNETRYVEVRLVNAGTGPARKVDISMRFVSGGPEIRWRSHVFGPGETQRFEVRVESDFNSPLLTLDEMASLYHQLDVTGKCCDLLDREVAIDQRLELRDTWRYFNSPFRLAQHEPLSQIARYLAEIRNMLRSRVNRERMEGWFHPAEYSGRHSKDRDKRPDQKEGDPAE